MNRSKHYRSLKNNTQTVLCILEYTQTFPVKEWDVIRNIPTSRESFFYAKCLLVFFSLFTRLTRTGARICDVLARQFYENRKRPLGLNKASRDCTAHVRVAGRVLLFGKSLYCEGDFLATKAAPCRLKVLSELFSRERSVLSDA